LIRLDLVKLPTPLLAIVLLLPACSTPARPQYTPQKKPLFYPLDNTHPTSLRRTLYSPTEVDGPTTRALKNNTWQIQGKTVDQEMADRRLNYSIRKLLNKEVAAE
jgi:hypothetical protein